MFAERLDIESDMTVKEAEQDDRVMQGRILVAPGDYHLRVFRSGGVYRVKLDQKEKVCGHRPSVEVLMQSVARYAGANAVGVMLTGMGGDGADGMLAMRQAGAKTFAQDEKSSVVFGMPRMAYERGGDERLVPLKNFAPTIINALRRN